MSNRFTRSGNVHRDDPSSAPRPQNLPYRVYGDQVALGETFHIQGDAEIRQEIEASLEFLAKQHLLEAEEKANKLVAKARTDAAAILEKANAQAKELLRQVQGEVDGIRENAHEEGFKAGFQEGYADATEHVEQETSDLLKDANTLVEGAYQAEKLVLKQFETQAIELIRHLTWRILQREIANSPETLMAMVHQAIESLYLSGKVQVVVSAQVIQDLRGYAARVQDSLDGMHRFEFIADPNLDVHQIFIIGQEGCFDLSPQTQLNQRMAPLEDQLVLPRPEPTEEPDAPTPFEPQANTEAPASTPKSAMADPDDLSAPATPEPTPEMPVSEATWAEPEMEAQLAAMAAEPEADAEADEPPPVNAQPYQFPALEDLAPEDPDEPGGGAG